MSDPAARCAALTTILVLAQLDGRAVAQGSEISELTSDATALPDVTTPTSAESGDATAAVSLPLEETPAVTARPTVGRPLTEPRAWARLDERSRHRVGRASARLYLRDAETDAARFELVCTLPCWVPAREGHWDLAVARPGHVELVVAAERALTLPTHGHLDVTFIDRDTSHVGGIVLIVLGGLALVAGLVMFGAIEGEIPSIGARSGILGGIPMAVGAALVIIGTTLTLRQPVARAHAAP